MAAVRAARLGGAAHRAESAGCTTLAVVVTLSHGTLFDRKVTLTAVPFSLIGLVLAIFLGFRNGAAYDR